MMKALIITVAGLSTRFNESLEKPVPKCIYYLRSPRETLLFRALMLTEEYDRIVIVGGYKIEMLRQYLNDYIPENILSRIALIDNKKYAEYGSGWSLYLGLNHILKSDEEYSDILFIEGDLFFCKDELDDVTRSDYSVITVNGEPIVANKAVALYFNEQNKPRYIYDTKHSLLEIKEPFKSIYNSAQIWKFNNLKVLEQAAKTLGEEKQKDTNLALINEYFDNLNEPIEIIRFNTWVNTNTTNDFKALNFNE